MARTVIVVAALALVACAGAGHPGSAPTPRAPTASSTSPAATTSGSPTPRPSRSCSPVGGGSASRATVTDVRVGNHDGDDRLVIEFDRAVPHFTIRPNPTGMRFTGSGRGETVTVAGTYGVWLQLTDIDLPNAYPHGTDLLPASAALDEVRVIDDFEGITDLGIGLRTTVCPTVSTLGGPPRLVVDLPIG
jgi:hypothetical protein